jgi:hypothetical protein
MQKRSAKKTLHQRLPNIFVFVTSITLLLGGILGYLPIPKEQLYFWIELSYIGLFFFLCYTLWVVWPHWKEEWIKNEEYSDN